MQSFGDRVKSLRKERGLTQDDFAEELTKIGEEKIKRSAVSMWEANRRRPKYEVLETIADYFNVDMEYLMGRTNVKREVTVLPEDSPSRIRNLRRVEMLKYFDRLSPSAQDLVLAQLRGAVQAQEAQDDQ